MPFAPVRSPWCRWDTPKLNYDTDIPDIGPLLKPDPGILFHPKKKSAHAKYAAGAAATLSTCVDFSTHVIDWCSQDGGAEFEAAAVLLYRELIEMLDAARVLIGEGVTHGTVPILRSMWEIDLQLAYLLEKDHVDRGLAYHVAAIRESIRRLKTWDPGTPQGKQFKLTWEDDLTSPDPFPGVDLQSEIGVKEAILQKAKFAAVNAAFDALPRSTSPWYAVNGGPGNLIDLTKYLHRGRDYELYYRPFSKTAHGQNAIAGLLLLDDGRQAYRPLRHPHQLVDICTHLGLIYLRATNGIIQTLAPAHRKMVGPWYELFVRPGFQAVRDHPGFAIVPPKP